MGIVRGAIPYVNLISNIGVCIEGNARMVRTIFFLV